jgi:hypothetical protein
VTDTTQFLNPSGIPRDEARSREQRREPGTISPTLSTNIRCDAVREQNSYNPFFRRAPPRWPPHPVRLSRSRSTPATATPPSSPRPWRGAAEAGADVVSRCSVVSAVGAARPIR